MDLRQFKNIPAIGYNINFIIILLLMCIISLYWHKKMLTLKPSKISFRSLLNISYMYVRKKQIDNITNQYGDTKLDQVKKITRVLAYITKQGLKSIRNDIALYKMLRNKAETQYTSQEWKELIRLHHDFFRLGPLFFIQLLPFSGPLSILFMYTYPGQIPSWFSVDKFHQDHQRIIRVAQKQAVQYFRNKSLQPPDININNMTLQQARKLSQCLYGYYSDGTVGYKKLFNRQLDYMIHENFSKYLIKRKLKHKFKVDLQHRNTFKNMNFEEKVRWKYEQVIVRGKLLKNYEDTLTAQELKKRKQHTEPSNNIQCKDTLHQEAQKRKQ